MCNTILKKKDSEDNLTRTKEPKDGGGFSYKGSYNNSRVENEKLSPELTSRN
jgi:hypothetical protein